MSRKPETWMKLDNAALIYPAVMNRNWTALFRLSAELTEDIDPEVLSNAVGITILRFPHLKVRLRHGMFWFYLERVSGAPRVQEDVGNPCVRMRIKENDWFALRVRYFQKRIAVEFFHVLADGTGGLIFLQTLVAEYLRLKYGANIPRGKTVLDCTKPPLPGESEDGFAAHAGYFTKSRAEEKAYRIHGTEETDGFVHITTGIIDVSEVMAAAKAKKVTLTEYLTAVLILSVDSIQRADEPRISRYRTIKVCVPINLRRFFPSDTLRNFSSYTNPGIDPRLGVYTFDEVLSMVHHFMAMEVTPKELNSKFTTNVKSEKNLALRVLPLFIKNVAMKIIFRRVGDRLSSTTLTNLGVVDLPEEMQKHVARMDFILGPLAANRVCAAALTYRNTLYLNFTRTIQEPNLEREFFSRLVKLGIHVKIESNQRS